MFKAFLFIVIVIAVAGIGGCAYLQHPKFGPSIESIRSAAVLASPNYVDGEFRNLEPTPILTEDIGFAASLFKYLTEEDPEGLRPNSPIPTVKTDLKALDKDEDTVIWLGHSSYYVQLGGRRILIDPVFGTYAAPVPFAVKVFEGANPYGVEDMPDIDYLLITHEHWDHLEYDTIKALEPKIRHAIGALGIGAYLALWGYPESKIHEADWDDRFDIDPGLTIHALPARHFARRLMATNQTLWVGFALASDSRRLFFSGDSGYGSHFAEIGRKFGGFDVVALDCGQYNPRWANIHMNPEEATQAAQDLRAQNLIPAHVGKFTLSNHAWDEPFRRLAEASGEKPYRLLTPRIGEPLPLAALPQSLPKWWEAVK
ncbi:MAG: MBL fold metallo-hydrolase [Rhodospirillales bacterium]|nr:MBL fold metallo-hydrolase [Rhodospirillales bacterium]